jgi:hypothetical protein
MGSQEKTKKNLKKKWYLAAVFAVSLIIILLFLVFLSREKTGSHTGTGSSGFKK